VNPAGRPVRFEPEPRKLVAVIIPAPTSMPDELMVTAAPTIAVDIVAIPVADTFSAVIPDSASNTPVIVVIPEMTAPPTILGTLPSVLAFRLFTLKSDIRDPKFEGHQ